MADDFRFRFRTTDLPAARNERGQFQSAIAIQRRRNTNLAEILANTVAINQIEMIDSRGRQGASTGRLRRATIDPKNRFSDNSNIGVGSPSFLDSSIAKYWRTFEEGSAATWSRPFVGTKLRFIGGKGGRTTRGGNARGSFTPSYHGQVPGVRTAKNPGFGASGLGVVTREIAPAHAYRKAYESGEPQEIFLQYSRQYISNLVSGLLGPTSNGAIVR